MQSRDPGRIQCKVRWRGLEGCSNSFWSTQRRSWRCPRWSRWTGSSRAQQKRLPNRPATRFKNIKLPVCTLSQIRIGLSMPSTEPRGQREKPKLPSLASRMIETLNETNWQTVYKAFFSNGQLAVNSRWKSKCLTEAEPDHGWPTYTLLVVLFAYCNFPLLPSKRSLIHIDLFYWQLVEDHPRCREPRGSHHYLPFFRLLYRYCWNQVLKIFNLILSSLLD